MALHPVGPLPASTYWRRRVVLLLAVVLVVLVVRSLLPDGGGKDSLATPTPTTTPTRTASPRPTTSTAPGACSDAALSLSVAPDAGPHVAGRPVRLTVTVKNVSSGACKRDLGGKVLEVVVRSGDDRIWSSDDCSTDHASSVQLLKAGASLETTVTWPGRRSARGCPTPTAESRTGTYTVRARVGTLRSPAAVLRLSQA